MSLEVHAFTREGSARLCEVQGACPQFGFTFRHLIEK
jgi:hypothetical protein